MRSSQLQPGQKTVHLDGDSFIVDGPVDLDLVKVDFPPGDALVLASGATGRIKRIEVDTRTEDGIKVQNANAQAAHDLEILDGYVRCHGKASGAHQDGIQVMGGRNLTFKSILFEGADTQGIFVNRAGSGATTPTDIVFEDCKVGCASPDGGPATPVNINVSVRTVLRNCEVWRSPRFGNGINIQSGAQGAVSEGNVERAVNAPGCEGEPGSTPDPEPDPDSLPLHVVSETATTITLGWTPVPGLGYRFSRSAGGGKFSHTWDATRDSVRFSRDSDWYKVEALTAGPFGEHP
jgi:Right handed beta helix region